MKYWQCREAFYYKNTDPTKCIEIWDFDTAAQAREMFNMRVSAYNSGEVDYSLVLNNGFTAIFENNVVEAIVIVTWYCAGYNGTKETLREGDILDETGKKEETRRMVKRSRFIRRG